KRIVYDVEIPASDIWQEIRIKRSDFDANSEFDALIEKYNEDPGMESNPDGYYFGKGEMVPEFEESAYSLEEGKTSGLVETSYGYHILLKLPLEDDEAIYGSNAFFSIVNSALYEEITKDLDSFTVEYAENHDARIADFEAEYQAKLAEAEEEMASEANLETEETAEAAE
ncbi:MAG: peptidylprolyl isomerase, partial [Clostridia bacterium]|nr:peptidylprolyl isomerase [Clostridia bacterium]